MTQPPTEPPALKWPYGLADFRRLIRDDYVYVDRTAHIRTLEQMGESLLFVRPRRFGKSLWLHTLSSYYDVANEGESTRLFAGLDIGREPTPLAHRFFTLEWNFSNIDPLGGGADDPVEGISALLDDYVNATIEAFASDYRDLLEEPVRVEKHAVRSFENLLAAIRRTPYRLYLLIDEYDNFANEILIGDEATYRRLIGADGPFKRLMKQVKAATEGRGLERLFLTGVTPVVLSDLTSGLNIAENVSLVPALNALCGFTESEVRGLITRLYEQGESSPRPTIDETLEMTRAWYNGYRFTASDEPRVYNPTLVLYFLKHLQREGTFPRQMLDTNLAADENKLRFLSRETDAGDVLATLVQTGEAVEVEHVEERFTLSEMLDRARRDQTTLASYLFYFGMLTIDGETPWRWLRLAPPNLVIRKLYIDQLLDAWFSDEEQADPHRPARALMSRGEIEPLLDLVEKKLFPRFSARDSRWHNELALKTAFAALLFHDVNYRLLSEAVIPGAGPDGEHSGFADLVLLRRPDARRAPLSDLLFEFKLVRRADLGEAADGLEHVDRESLARLPAVQGAFRAAEAQARRYRDGLEATYGSALRLRSWAVVAIGFERLLARELPSEG